MMDAFTSEIQTGETSIFVRSYGPKNAGASRRKGLLRPAARKPRELIGRLPDRERRVLVRT
jgi:hypothetical protein